MHLDVLTGNDGHLLELLEEVRTDAEEARSRCLVLHLEAAPRVDALRLEAGCHVRAERSNDVPQEALVALVLALLLEGLGLGRAIREVLEESLVVLNHLPEDLDGELGIAGHPALGDVPPLEGLLLPGEDLLEEDVGDAALRGEVEAHYKSQVSKKIKVVLTLVGAPLVHELARGHALTQGCKCVSVHVAVNFTSFQKEFNY